MPEIEILRVLENPRDPVTYDVETAGRETLVDNDPDFGVVALAAIGDEHGVTRWAYATDEDQAKFDTLPYIAERLILIGWAEAPIARDDVEFHRVGYGSNSLPAVNIKVQDLDLPQGESFKALVGEFELDSRLAALGTEELLNMVERYVRSDKDDVIFQVACETAFEDTKDRAIEEFFAGYDVTVFAEGRSGGWLVVDGLPDIGAWGAELLTKWHAFVEFCAAQVADVPRLMAWHVLANCQDALAGRVVRVELTLVLSDDDMENVDAEANPATWDWHDMLDLSRESNIRVRKL